MLRVGELELARYTTDPVGSSRGAGGRSSSSSGAGGTSGLSPRVARSGSSLRADSRWLRAEPVLNLWQVDRLRHDFTVSAGLELRSRLDLALSPLTLEERSEPLALATPARTDLKLGSSRHALTMFRTGVELAP